jgi:Zn-dependent membrane protease YugP
MFGDSLIWILILPGVVLGGLAQSWVKKNVMAYSRVPIRQRLTGAEIARHILDSKGLHEVRIEPVF